MRKAAMTIPLSLLDLAPVGGATDGRAAIRHTVELARRAEDLGYQRIWYAEHHGMAGVASAATEVLIAAAASATSRIRVGAGGVMLPNHAPLQVVERYRTLEALFPDRIDLGLGRAPGTDPRTSQALRRQKALEDVNQLLIDVLAFDSGRFPEGHPHAGVLATPVDVELPDIWMLGSSLAGAQIAAQLGVAYAFAGHFNLDYAERAMKLYRERFQPSERLQEPRAMLAVSALCGEDDAHGRRLAAVTGLTFLRMAQARPTGERLPTIEEANAYPYTDEERAHVEHILGAHVFGSPATVRKRIEELVELTQADEVMVSAMFAETDERVRSFERIADVFARD
jgi:luciferase family oxidoreductase group 1